MNKLRVLGISASPRKKGNSRFLLEHALNSAKAVAPDIVETEMYLMGMKQFAGCIACYKCVEKKDCAIEDDFQELRDKWVLADSIIYSIPVYHMGLPGQIKCFIDRLGSTLYSTYGGIFKQLKTVGVITQGAHIFAGQEQVMTAINNHAVLLGCVPVAGDLWQCYIGAAGWTCNELATDSIENFYENGSLDAQAAVEGSQSLGRRVVEVEMILKDGGASLSGMLAKDQTNIYSMFLDRLTDPKKLVPAGRAATVVGLSERKREAAAVLEEEAGFGRTLTIDADKCTACKACELVCSFTNEGAFVPSLSRIRIVRFMEQGHNVPTVCRNCNRPACMDVCPADAIARDPNTGMVVISEDMCIGCGECVKACPYGAVELHEDEESAYKCDLCGGEPACVPNCIYGALTFEEQTHDTDEGAQAANA